MKDHYDFKQRLYGRRSHCGSSLIALHANYVLVQYLKVYTLLLAIIVSYIWTHSVVYSPHLRQSQFTLHSGQDIITTIVVWIEIRSNNWTFAKVQHLMM